MKGKLPKDSGRLNQLYGGGGEGGDRRRETNPRSAVVRREENGSVNRKEASF